MNSVHFLSIRTRFDPSLHLLNLALRITILSDELERLRGGGSVDPLSILGNHVTIFHILRESIM